MRYCPNCGATLSATTRFCPDCGEATGVEDTRVAPSEETRVAAPRWDAAPPARVEPIRPASVGPAERGQMRMPKEPQEEDERVVFSIRPTLLFVKIGYALAVLTGLLLVVLLSFVSQVPVWVSILLALVPLLVPAYHHIRRNMIRYTLTDSKIEIDEGFISQTTRNIPLRNIQDVTVKTTIFQRLLGFGDVVVDNANELGGPTILDNIPQPRRHMDMLLRELRRWR